MTLVLTNTKQDVRIISSVIDNKEQTASNELSKQLDWCDSAIFVTAFFTDTTYVRILLMARTQKKIKLVVSLRPPTCPEAISQVLDLCYKFKERIEVRFLGSELHSKIYALEKGNQSSFRDADYWAMIGSSNMTDHGFSKNIETNVVMTGLPASDAYMAAIQIFDQAHRLTTSALIKYQERFKKHRKEDEFVDINPEETDIPEDYDRVHKAFMIIRRICAKSLYESFANYPEPFVIDHFWHFIDKVKNPKEIASAINTKGQDKAIQDLFGQFAIWCDQPGNEFGFNYIDEMLSKSSRLQYLINEKSDINSSESREIILTFHAALSARTQRGRVNYDRLIEQNSPIQVHQYFKALADTSVSFSKRLQNALDNKDIVKGIGPSSIQEFNGWMYPDDYCIWNEKTDRAMKKLEFS
ncbi:hypothetical protein FV767_03715 [Vibrio parahaemolyticus]|nr:hypothetical protein [Vibrio parahaemolyticus]